jgi:hypothetical protein
VDDGSTDGTRDILVAYVASVVSKIIYHERNLEKAPHYERDLPPRPGISLSHKTLILNMTQTNIPCSYNPYWMGVRT